MEEQDLNYCVKGCSFTPIRADSRKLQQSHFRPDFSFLYWVAKIISSAESAGGFSQIMLPTRTQPSAGQIEIEYITGTRILLQGDFTAALIKSIL